MYLFKINSYKIFLTKWQRLMEVLILFSYFPLVNTPKVKAIKGISLRNVAN